MYNYLQFPYTFLFPVSNNSAIVLYKINKGGQRGSHSCAWRESLAAADTVNIALSELQ